MKAKRPIIAFDLYGTLISTDSIAKRIADICRDEPKAQQVATQWRRYQLEYSWRITAMGLYKPFPQLTQAALEHAAAESGLSISPSDVQALMAAYDSLDVFPDVTPALESIRAAIRSGQGVPGPHCLVFSNGSPAAIRATVTSSRALSLNDDIFREPVSVDDVGAFKPARSVYDHLVRAAASTDGEDEAELWLVSSNPFDVVGARAAGINAAWIDRTSKGWIDRLGNVIGKNANGEDVKPSFIASGVDKAVAHILQRHQEKHSDLGE